MSAQRPGAKNTEASKMIEGALYELIPSINKAEAERVARKFASMRPFQSLDQRTEKEHLKVQLRQASRRLLQVSERKRRPAFAQERKEPPETERPDADLRHVLLRTVGKAKYKAILSVYHEIRNIRRLSWTWARFSQARSRPSEAERAPASESLPAPIVDIYFRTRLVDVMSVVDASAPLDDAPEPSDCIVRRSDWDRLLEDARTNLAAFRRLEQEHVGEGDDPPARRSSTRRS